MNYPKTTLDQTQEIERLVADVLEKLDQVRYSLQTLETRLKESAVAPGAPSEAPGSAPAPDARASSPPPPEAPLSPARPSGAPSSDDA